jgi:hypothetical protein
MRRTRPQAPWSLALFLLLAGCIEIGDLYPFRLQGDDDDDSAADDDDSAVGDDDDSAVGDDDDDGTPCDVSWLEASLDPVSFAFEVEPLFSSNCGPCHTIQDLGGLRMTPGLAWEALVGEPNLLGYGDGMPRVTPFDPQASYLMHKLVRCGADDPEWGHYQSEMPPPIGDTVPLTDPQINLIYSWIVQGAEDN